MNNQTQSSNYQLRAAERTKELIPMCRYYKGEEASPFHYDISDMFWDYERFWVNAMADSYTHGHEWRKNLEDSGLQYAATKYHIPTTLLGLLYNRFKHWGSGFETNEDFIIWIEKDYLNIKK